MTAYLAFHEKEVYDIMRYLMSQEQITADRLNAVRRESRQEGRQEEFLASLAALADLNLGIYVMTKVTRRSEEDVIAGLQKLGLPIPS